MALKADQPTRNKGKGRQQGATKGNCQNCGKKRHYIKDCWAKGGGKEGQAPKWFKQPKETDTAKQSIDNNFAFVTNEVTCVTISASDWLGDSAAITHIAWDKNIFIDYQEEIAQIEGITPGATLCTHGRGTVALQFKVNDTIFPVTLSNVKHAPAAPNNLISIGRLTDKGCTVNFTTTGAEFKLRTGVIFGIGRKVGQMYQMRVRPKKLGQECNFVAVAKGQTLDKWHRILKHVNPWTVQTMHRNNLVTGLIIDKSQTPTQCTTCIQGKQHVDPFPKDA